VSRTLEVAAAALALATAIALAWQCLRRADDPRDLALRWLFSLLVVGGAGLLLWYLARRVGAGSFVAAFGLATLIAGGTAAVGITLGIIWAPYLGSWIAGPFERLYLGGNEEAAPQPLYSVAEARRKRGRYDEAVAEVRAQLARFPDDLTGTLLLADIQAANLGDVAAALTTLEEWVARAGGNSPWLPLALGRIADLHLRHRTDPAAAREALERIVQLRPGTDAARLASQRLAHLPTVGALEERAHPHLLHLETYPQDLGLRPKSAALTPPTEDPAALAAELLRHLEQSPDDEEARERLARLYAEQLGRIDRARAELEQLLARTGTSDRQAARWLNQLADLETRWGDGAEAARAALQRIIDRQPVSAAADQARQRLTLLRLELRHKQTSQTFRLGSSPQSGESRTGVSG
jgi:tetratricopeptide (TPR) repeat protein